MITKEILTLLEKVRNLGNHYKKNIEHVKKLYPHIGKLLSTTHIDQKVNFNHRSHRYHQEMGYLIQLPADQRTVLDALGCYFTLQLLWLNIDNLNWLDYQLSHTKSRNIIFRRFILSAGKNFRSLTAAYMHHLIYLFKGDNEIPLYTITGVGTRSDQDDIDVGIIDDGSANRMMLNRIIHRMSAEMMRFASYFHFHLWEQ